MASDAEEIRTVARAVTGLAARARAAAVAVSGAHQVRWESLGAERFRTQLHARVTELNRCAVDLDHLAATLLAHAGHVEAHELAVVRAALTAKTAAQTAARDLSRVGEDLHTLWDDTGGKVLDHVPGIP